MSTVWLGGGGGGGSGSVCVKEQPDQVERCPVETVETAHRQPGP